MIRKIRLAVIGDYSISDDYSNTKYLLDEINKDSSFKITYRYGENEKDQKYYFKKYRYLSSLLFLIKRFYRGLKAAFAIYKTSTQDIDIIYVPYLSLIPLFIYSFLPNKGHTPFIVADGLISIYDTTINDRSLLKKTSWLAKILWLIEYRAFSHADRILVDTKSNALFFSEIFKLPIKKFHPMPLCINEKIFLKNFFYNHNDQINVLFAGGFIPLQGVDIIAQAASILSNKPFIKFHLVGDGQTADSVAKYLSSHKANISWKREWISQKELAHEYAKADICLGVFGKTDKCLRVWPFKNYLAMSSCKPIISTRVDDNVLKHINEDHYFPVPPNNPQELAKAIITLTDSKTRKSIAYQGWRFYQENLSNRKAVANLHNLYLDYQKDKKTTTNHSVERC